MIKYKYHHYIFRNGAMFMTSLSRKQMNQLFLKALIKLKLSSSMNLDSMSVSEVKEQCIKLLWLYDYKSESLSMYIQNITKSQYSSFNDRAEKTIKTLNLKNPSDIKINTDNINSLKPLYYIEDIKNSVIDILSDLKRMVQK